ncbi:MAG: thioredoxin-dependent thiol peroxidase [Alkalispirochaetaceae bacterium]
MLEVGDKAPDFTLPDQDGKEVRLADYAGKRVILYFYPKDDTPGCTKEACSIRDTFPALSEKDAVVFGISADSVESHRKFKAKHNLPFTLLSDPDKQVIQAYGAWGTKKMYGKEYEVIMRYTYLIAPDGTVEKAFDKVKTASHGEELLGVL